MVKWCVWFEGTGTIRHTVSLSDRPILSGVVVFHMGRHQCIPETNIDFVIGFEVEPVS